MALHHLVPGRRSCRDLIRIRIDEAGDAHARRSEPADHRSDGADPLDHVEPALGGHLLAPLRHQAGGVRPVSERDGLHLGGHRHLEVERPTALAGDVRQGVDVGVGDVPAVFAQVRRDPVRARHQRDLRRADGVGIAFTTRVPHGGHMVDVHAEAEAGQVHHSEIVLIARRF